VSAGCAGADPQVQAARCRPAGARADPQVQAASEGARRAGGSGIATTDELPKAGGVTACPSTTKFNAQPRNPPLCPAAPNPLLRCSRTKNKGIAIEVQHYLGDDLWAAPSFS